MRLALQRWLDSPRTVLFASLVTLAIGLFFVFVWAPHPWSWRGIDQYDELARALARGEPFGTTDVPWGYAYFVAVFYRLFPDTPWASVTAQVFINALVPYLLYRLARPAVGRRVAALAAWIVAVFSFNTIYASTQTSDSICTVLFLLTLLCFVHAHKTSQTWAFAAAGVLAGLTPQFRPNMILLPVLVIGAYLFYPPRSSRKVMQCAVCMAAMVAMLMPWIIRNYRYTGTIQPTSTHSGIQLWYGTLQVGPYLESRAHNPRYHFASAAFDYTSLERSIFVSAETPCRPDGGNLKLAYRTDRDPQLRWLEGRSAEGLRRVFEIPAQASPATIYYFFDSNGVTYPAGGERDPLVMFVTGDHLGDLDRRHELLDIFDVYRLMRHIAWQEPLPAADQLDLNGNGGVERDDLAAAIARLLPRAQNPFVALDNADTHATLRLSDGSWLAMPRSFNSKQTGVDLQGELAGALVSSRLRFAELRNPAPPTRCAPADLIRINDVFYRKEPHEMRRYTSLAFDNISRDPVAFAQASAYRLVRLFIVRSGTGDQLTTFQFAGSRMIFNAGLILSSAYFALFLAGVVIAWRARSPFLYALIPIAYVPLTICFVLTNMRYTITVQPLMFVFVAMTVAALLGLGKPAAEVRRD
jgi:multisubunit Na+/H+ antiporter MnhF subunit